MQKIKHFLQQGISPVWAIVIIVALGVLAATAVLVHGYFGTSEVMEPESVVENKTTGWQTYRNEELGYELRHPSNFLIVDNLEDNKITINAEDRVLLTIRTEISEFSLDEEIEAIVENMKQEITQGVAPVTIEYEPYSISSLNGYLITEMRADVQLTTREFFEVQKGNILYSFIYSYHGYILFENPEDVLAGGPVIEEFKKELQLKLKDYGDIQTIISTFRFVEVEDETADWQTYRNEEYGFEIKYPEDWFLKNNKDQFKRYCWQDYCIESISIENLPNKLVVESVPYIPSNSAHLWIAVYDDDLEKNNLKSINFGGKLINASFFKNVLSQQISFEYNQKRYDVFYEAGNEDFLTTLNQMLSTFRFIEVDRLFEAGDEKSFEDIAVLGELYSKVKKELIDNGWMPIIPDEYESGLSTHQDPISLDFIEIASCGSGINGICNVDFEKDGKKAHLNLNQKKIDGEFKWIVAGIE